MTILITAGISEAEFPVVIGLGLNAVYQFLQEFLIGVIHGNNDGELRTILELLRCLSLQFQFFIRQGVLLDPFLVGDFAGVICDISPGLANCFLDSISLQDEDELSGKTDNRIPHSLGRLIDLIPGELLLTDQLTHGKGHLYRDLGLQVFRSNLDHEACEESCRKFRVETIDIVAYEEGIGIFHGFSMLILNINLHLIQGCIPTGETKHLSVDLETIIVDEGLVGLLPVEVADLGRCDIASILADHGTKGLGTAVACRLLLEGDKCHKATGCIGGSTEVVLPHLAIL